MRFGSASGIVVEHSLFCYCDGSMDMFYCVYVTTRYDIIDLGISSRRISAIDYTARPYPSCLLLCSLILPDTHCTTQASAIAMFICNFGSDSFIVPTIFGAS